MRLIVRQRMLAPTLRCTSSSIKHEPLMVALIPVTNAEITGNIRHVFASLETTGAVWRLLTSGSIMREHTGGLCNAWLIYQHRLR
jgi:hypothetical protein